jgi:SAM-dependent methyltransferase
VTNRRGSSGISLDAGSLAGSLGFSLRRHYIDDFYSRHIPGLPAGSLVLDLAGNRIGKRGSFNIDKYGLKVTYANLSVEKRPHVQASAESLPFKEDLFDGVICSEMLEHVMNPLPVLYEIRRVMKPNGVLLMSAPFLNRIHGDPSDYGRYTDFFWRNNLDTVGFSVIALEKQGLFWSVMADMMREWLYCKALHFKCGFLLSLLGTIVSATKRAAVKLDSSDSMAKNPVLSSYTSGFGIRAIKI